MANQQQFCLKWNNHTNNMVKVFNQLLDDENFVDVTLACDGASIKAHKMVLSACSTYFKELFVCNPCKHPIVILKDMRYDDLKAIINFMYCGEVNVSQSQLGALLKTAEVLKVKGLTEVNDKQTDSLNTQTCNYQNKLISDSLSQNVSSNVLSQSASVVRKKRRRRGNHQTTTSMSGESEHESSQTEDSCDETQPKKTKDVSSIADSSSRSSKDSRSLLSESNNANKGTKNDVQNTSIMQTRRRQTLQHNIETESNRDVSNEAHNVSDQRINNGNQSELWQQTAQQSVLCLPSTETEDESEDMFDVKPIISFEESPVTASNAIALREDSTAIMTSASDANAIAGPSAAQSGKICVCHLCHLTFTAYSSLRRHMARHYADRERYECEICLKSYSRKDYLKEHKKLKHAIG